MYCSTCGTKVSDIEKERDNYELKNNDKNIRKLIIKVYAAMAIFAGFASFCSSIVFLFFLEVGESVFLANIYNFKEPAEILFGSINGIIYFVIVIIVDAIPSFLFGIIAYLSAHKGGWGGFTGLIILWFTLLLYLIGVLQIEYSSNVFMQIFSISLISVMVSFVVSGRFYYYERLHTAVKRLKKFDESRFAVKYKYYRNKKTGAKEIYVGTAASGGFKFWPDPKVWTKMNPRKREKLVDLYKELYNINTTFEGAKLPKSLKIKVKALKAIILLYYIGSKENDL